MNREDLKRRDFYLLVDRSTSMGEPAKRGGTMTRWQEAEEATVGIARFCEQFDDDGISVMMFSNGQKLFNNVTSGSDLVKKLFTENQPNGGTDTAAALLAVTNDYFARKAKNASEAKPLIIFVVTDGEPNSKEDLQRAIESIAAKVDNAEEIRINFVQIGDNADARAYLRKLDSELNCKYDIVNCKTDDEVANYSTLSDAMMAMVNDEAEAKA